MVHMKIIATHEAKTHLSRYLKEVESGQTIVISRGQKPLAKLVPFDTPNSTPRPKVGQSLDQAQKLPDSTFQPLSDEELSTWGL